MAGYKKQVTAVDEARPHKEYAEWRAWRSFHLKEITQEEFLALKEKIAEVDRRELNDKERTFDALLKSQYDAALIILEYTKDIDKYTKQP